VVKTIPVESPFDHINAEYMQCIIVDKAAKLIDNILFIANGGKNGISCIG